MSGKSFIICFLGFIITLSSCYDEMNTYGQQLTDSKFRNISVDTSTVLVTAVHMDSIETSGKSTALIGQYTHKDWGTIHTCSYIPFNRPTYSTEISETVVLDSMILRMSYKGHSIGDTTLNQHFFIHRLTEKIILNDNGYLYNTSSVTYDPEILGEFTFKPKPGSGDILEVRLSDEFGQDMLTLFHTQDDAVSTDRFEDYFKGIAIIPDELTSQSIQSFSVGDSLMALALHYRILHKSEEMLLFMPKTETQFNHIDHNRDGSLLQNYSLKENEIPSEELNDKGLLFSGLGWYSRLEFPSLNNILQQGEIVDIESAFLMIQPEVGSYSGYNTLPDSIYLYIADENNIVIDAVTDYLGTEVQQGTLTIDNAYPENTFYYFDVTTFMQEELGANGKNKHNLQLVFNNDYYTTTFKNLTFGNQNGKLPITLHLTYRVYESY